MSPSTDSPRGPRPPTSLSTSWARPATLEGSRRLGIGAVAIGAIVWGTEGILVRQLDLDATTIAGARLTLTAIMGLVIGLIRPDILTFMHHGEWLRVMILGSLVAFSSVTFITALRLTEIGVAVVVTFTWPLWLSVLYWILKIDSLTRRAVARLSLSFIGVVLLAMREGPVVSHADMMGIGAAIVTAITVSAIVMITRSASSELSSLTLQFWQSTFAAGLLAPLAVAKLDPDALDLRVAAVLVVLGIGVAGAGGAFFLSGVRRLTATEVGVLSFLEPVAATILAGIFLQEIPSSRGLAGMALIIGVGVWTVARAEAANDIQLERAPPHP